MRLVIGRGAVVAAIGVTAGFVASVLAGRLVAALLYGVTPRDPLAFAAAAVTLFATVVAAAWLPARRAARSEPAIALRES
jgi:ABC-type antimicrobial peptide transport system permease subunit